MAERTIIIDEAWPTKNGTRTWIKDTRGQKYLCVPNEFLSMVGQTIQADVGVFNPKDGPPIATIDDYKLLDPAPPHQQQDGLRPNQAPSAPVSPPASGVNREASIVAQALAKTVSCQDAHQAWNVYQILYAKYLQWDGSPKQDKPAAPAQATTEYDYDDQIPF